MSGYHKGRPIIWAEVMFIFFEPGRIPQSAVGSLRRLETAPRVQPYSNLS